MLFRSAPGCAIRPETVIDAIVQACDILDQKEAVMKAGGDPRSVGGAATWDGGVDAAAKGAAAERAEAEAPASNDTSAKEA